MPAKNSVKKYVTDGYYHIYNRGVEKRKIFQDNQDYRVFLSYLKTYLKPKEILVLQNKLADAVTSWREKSRIINLLALNNFYGEIKLLVYCLMPNHFHFLIKQKNEVSITSFMNSLITKYTMYFNKKNRRIGHLFQGRYKAILVESDEQLLHLSRYIHRNPIGAAPIGEYSSYEDYLGKRKTDWLTTKQILAHFSQTNLRLTYKAFVEERKFNNIEVRGLQKLFIDD